MTQSDREAYPKTNFRLFIKLLQVVETQKYWFAARTLSKQEFAVKKRIENLNLEEGIDVECYLPTRTVISQLKYRRKRSVVPVARGLIFIHATKQSACDIHNVYGVQVFYMKDFSTHSMLVVPDKQMHDFMFLLDFSSSGVEVLNKNLKRGDRVRVTKGPLQGLEGELVRLMGHKRVVIRLEGVVSIATSYIPGSFLERVE